MHIKWFSSAESIFSAFKRGTVVVILTGMLRDCIYDIWNRLWELMMIL